MSIECMKYNPVNKGSLVGYADIYVTKWDWEIYGCSLHQKDGKRWVNLPQKEYQDKQTGEKKYAFVNRFRNKNNFEAFQKAVKEAIEKKAAESSYQQPEPEINDELPF